MNYINEYSIYGLMNKNSIYKDNISFYKTKDKTKITICKKRQEEIEKLYREVKYMYLDENPKIKGSYKLPEITSLIDNSYSLNNINRQNHKEIYETIRKYYHKLNIYTILDKDLLDKTLNFIETWKYTQGWNYGFQEHSSIDKSFFNRFYNKEIDNNAYNIFIFEKDNNIIGYSVIENKISDFDNNIPKFNYIIRKNLIKCSWKDRKSKEICYYSAEGLRNLTEYIDWYIFNYILEKTSLNQIIIDWGCGNINKGVGWYKTHKWPIYKLENKWFCTIKF